MTNLGIAGVGDATLIASGGSALVYEAVSGTGQRVAVKVLRGIRGAEVSRRFEREQSAAERLGDHPNIIRIHHNGTTPAGEPYLVMPLMPAGSLDDEIEARGAFPLHQAVKDVTIAAGAIDYAHHRGVLHRDIKPANLLRSDDGSVIVTDFGIARVVDAGITSATVGAATPLYAAPELLAENEASIKSEVYSLGALLYTLLAGRAAFSDSANIWATMHRIRTEPPASIPGVPAAVMALIQRAMAKEPVDRPASAGEFARLLNAASRGDDSWQPAAPIETTEFPSGGVPIVPAVDLPTVLAGEQARSFDPPTSDPPPIPAFDRPAPAVGAAPGRDSRATKIVASIAAIAIVAAVAWWGTVRLLDSNSVTAGSGDGPVDNSIPPPAVSPSAGSGNGDGGDGGEGGQIPPDGPTQLVSFTGDYYTALLPKGWSLSSRDVDQGYGFRSSFVAGDMYLHVDTTPREQRPPGVDIAQSARDIAAGINSASAVETEEIEGLLVHSFTFLNRQGVDSIDIFFEVDGDGYAIVAGSPTEPAAVFDIARMVALSIQST